MSITIGDADKLDLADPLRTLRNEFVLPQGVVYLDGNSLGALPRATTARMRTLIANEWGQGLVRSYNSHGWIDAPLRVGNKVAKLVGAGPGEVVVADSTSVNLFKAICAASQINPRRSLIVSEPGNFPSDLYIAQGVQALSGGRLRLKLVERSELERQVDESVAALMLTHVHYKTAAMHDMAALTACAQKCGALTIWDLSHSAGAVRVELSAAGADFAVGCGYKYLNGGPGAPAYIYVAKRHQGSAVSPLAGWLGHARPFDFVDDYRPAVGIERYLCGSPPILGITALEIGVDLLLRAGLDLLVEKSRRLRALFIEEAQERCGSYGLELASAPTTSSAGSHVAFRHPGAYAIIQAMIARNVIGDFRAPDILRFGLAPAYIGFRDVWNAVSVLEDVLRSGIWRRSQYQERQRVT